MTDETFCSNGIAEAVDLLAGNRVLVVGDVMLDQYQVGVVERISPEAPVPVVRIESEEYVLGGAANVARNIQALGGRATLLGFSGEDRSGERIQSLLASQEIERHIIRSKSRPTTVKTRVMAQGQQIVRIDKEAPGVHDQVSAQNLLDRLRQLLPVHSVVIVSDYGKGVVTTELLAVLTRAAQDKGTRILVDPKIQNFSLYKDVFILTPNTKEAGQAAGLGIHSREDILAAGSRILKTTGAQNLLITLGEQGMALFQSSGAIWHCPTTAKKVFDVTGAGDTVIATLGLGLSSGIGLLTSCIMSNFAAGHVVGQVGTAVVTVKELKDSIGFQSLSCIDNWNPTD